MSDFFNSGWSIYIAAVTLAGIVACLLLLWVAARRKVMANDNTTGHVWDEDLRELNNPLPRWWMGLFVLTIVFSFGYLALYPGLGSFAGTLGWTQRQAYDAEVERLQQQVAPLYARFAGMSAPQLATDAPAMRIGERLFINNCAQCHGSDARGSKGFPDLTDKVWLHGWGEQAVIDAIQRGKDNQMPAHADKLTPEQIRVLAAYVWSLSQSKLAATQ